MKYSISINQKAVIDAGFDLDLVDMAIFDMLTAYTNSTACRKMNEGAVIYFNVPYQTVIEELPLAKITKPDSVYRRFQKLEHCGIMQMHHDNKRMKQVWFAWGRNYSRLYFEKQTGSKSGQPEKPAVRPDQNPVQTGLKSGLRPDQNPSHNNTIPFTNHFTEGVSTRAEIEILIDLNAEEKNTPPSSAPPPPQSRLETWISELTTDYTIEEGFTIGKKIPSSFFREYASRFPAIARTQADKYNKRSDFTGHFLNWSLIQFQNEGKKQKDEKFTFDLNKSVDGAAEWLEQYKREMAAERAMRGY